jgi:hypothetical protein
MRKATTISERRACWLVGLARTVFNCEPKAKPADAELTQRLVELAHELGGATITSSGRTARSATKRRRSSRLCIGIDHGAHNRPT